MDERCNANGLAIDDLHREKCQLQAGHSGPHRIARADQYGRTFVEWDESAINALKRRTCPVCNLDGVHEH
jgi:hypothetical protein